MGRTRKLWLLLPRQVRHFPPDLAAVFGLVVAVGFATSVPGLRESVFRILVGVPFVLFVPGYAVTAALFPESRESDAGTDRTDARFFTETREGITLLERLLFSAGLSVVIVPLVGLALNFTPWGIGFASLALSIGGFTVTTALVASVRRHRLPPEARFRIPYEDWYAAVPSGLFQSSSRLEATLNVVILLSTLIALGSGAYAILGPQEDQSFTEFYLLAENESGDLVADSYPTTFSEGQSETLVVGIGNHEHRTTEYSVIVRMQRFEMKNGSATVADTRQIDQFRVEVAANETVHRRHTVTPQMSGEWIRLQYLLYTGDPPANPTGENAYRSVHLWVNATNQ